MRDEQKLVTRDMGQFGSKFFMDRQIGPVSRRSPCTLGQPIAATSCRDAPVQMNSIIASRALLPVGWCSLNQIISWSVQVW